MLSGQTLLGKILRAPLALIPRESTIRILRGPLRGKKWVVGASSNACWAGTYETANLSAFAAAITAGDTVYDVGANVGIYTLAASVAAGPSGIVYAFEPVERNLHYLRRHAGLNQLRNCRIVDVAVSDVKDTQKFSSASWHHAMGRLSPDGELEVASVTLDHCVYERQFQPPKVIKIDVEGAELRVLQGASRVLNEYHPSLFLEIHGGQSHAACREFLIAKGYRLREAYGVITATWER